MKNKIFVCICVLLAICFTMTGVTYSAEKESAGAKMKTFWQKLFNYPANVTKESASVVTDNTTRGTNVVTNAVKTAGQVTSGELDKTKDLITEPITGTAETTVKVVEGVVNVPAAAAKEEAAPITAQQEKK